MDDRRFDSLVKALAEGRSRRSVLKGLLGLGGAAAIGSTVLETDSEAARRPTPTPRPPRCPGQQTYVNGQCVCQVPPAPGPEKCGPDCCTKGVISPGTPGYSECCDQACCFGTCLPEEGCCATNNRPGGLPPTHEICDTVSGRECCIASDVCCLVDGCCPTVCYGGAVDADNCCPESNFCPGGSESPDRCCLDGTTCCGGGTDENYCADFSTGGCCETIDCPPPAAGACSSECVAGQCQPVTCSEGQICCLGACVSVEGYESCPADPNGCCVRGEEICCGAGGCCVGDQCNEIVGACCDALQTPCGTGENACCDELFTCCRNSIDRICCLEGLCTTDGDCCTGDDIACGAECCPEIRCGIHAETGGPACCLPTEIACGELPGGCCLTAQCNQQTFQCCESGTHPCLEGCCVDDPCENIACVEACQHCVGGQCVANDNFTSCSGGYCLNGFCQPCIANSTPDSLFSCSFGVECCSGCCLDSVTAANACQTQFEGFPDLLAACNTYLAPFLGGDVCTSNPLPIPGTDASVELPCKLAL